MTIPEDNWNNFLLLDSQKGWFKALKNFAVRINNYLKGFQRKIILEDIFIVFDQG